MLPEIFRSVLDLYFIGQFPVLGKYYYQPLPASKNVIFIVIYRYSPTIGPISEQAGGQTIRNISSACYAFFANVGKIILEDIILKSVKAKRLSC